MELTRIRELKYNKDMANAVLSGGDRERHNESPQKQ
jgi:hypothetical protein